MNLAGISLYFRRNPLRFARMRSQYRRRLNPDRSSAPDAAVFDTLLRDGVAVIRDFYDRTTVDQMAAEAHPWMQQVAAGSFTGAQRTDFLPDHGVFRLHRPNELMPSVQRFVDDEFTTRLAKALFSPLDPRAGIYADYKPTAGAFDYSVMPHIDHWRARLKCFLLLKDVTPDNAPMIYWKRSHNYDDPWHFWTEYNYWQDKDYATFNSMGQVLPAVADKLAETYHYERLIAALPAGTLIIADMRGLHAGTVLRHGYRLQLVKTFADR